MLPPEGGCQLHYLAPNGLVHKSLGDLANVLNAAVGKDRLLYEAVLVVAPGTRQLAGVSVQLTEEEDDVFNERFQGTLKVHDGLRCDGGVRVCVLFVAAREISM